MIEGAEGNTAKWLMQYKWTSSPTQNPEGQEVEYRGRCTKETIFSTTLCPNKKLPLGAPKMHVIRLPDSAKGFVQQVQRWANSREHTTTLGAGPASGRQRSSGTRWLHVAK